MSSLRAKIENICRLCLSGDGSLESIFGDSGGDALQTIIYDCTSIRIQPKMGLPSSICVACKTKVESFHQFRECCIGNDEYLRSALLLAVENEDEDEDEVVIKMEPEVLLDEERSEADPKELIEKDVPMVVDRNDNEITRPAYMEHDKPNGKQRTKMATSDRDLDDEWDDDCGRSNDVDSHDGNSSDSLSIQQDMSPELTTLLKCEFCSQKFTVLEQLKRHITSHKEERIFQCYYCPKTFHFAKNLNMHVEYIHSKAKYAQTPPSKLVARQQFHVHSSSSNNSSVSQSTNGGLSPVSPALDSSDCLNNNTIASGAAVDVGAGLSLNINLNGVTTTPTDGNGTLLGRNITAIRLPLARSTSTRDEGRRVGSGAPPPERPTGGQHECHVCHKGFPDAVALRQHMLLHAGEKPYKCDICSKSFFNASTLKTHQRIHSDQNPYRCGTCTKMFDNARSLELHHRTHTGEKPYACDVCLKKFSCSSNLKRHRKLHDRD